MPTTNLRQGTVELPLNDRSADLLTQLSSIKAGREVDKETMHSMMRIGHQIHSNNDQRSSSRSQGLYDDLWHMS
eukprot:scaffold20262_cov129-Skeletonema_dohrnii-CCMP3373.AAC.4